MSEVSKLNLDDDYVEALGVEDAERWVLERKGDLEVWTTVSPLDLPDERFTARLLWIVYPGDLPPSVQFVEPATARLGVTTAWPEGAGFRPPNDICATWTLEGYTAHPEWKNDRAKRLKIQGNALLLTLRNLQQALDSGFIRRHRQ